MPIIEVLELPLKALDNKSVNLEFRKRDIKALVGEAPTAILLRLSGLAKAWIQVDNHIKLWLMKVSSTSRSPETLAFNGTFHNFWNRKSQVQPLWGKNGGKNGEGKRNLYKSIVFSSLPGFFLRRNWVATHQLFPVILVGRNFAHGNFQISPGAFVVFSFSRPARSTKKASEVTMVLSLPPPDNEFQKKRGNGLGIWINPGVIHKSDGFLFMILQLLNEFEYGY